MSLLFAACGGEDGASDPGAPGNPDPGKLGDAGTSDASASKARPDPNAPPATLDGKKL